PNKPAQYLHRRPRTGSFELRSCLLILAGFQKNHAEIQPRRGVTGIHLYSLFALLDGEIVMPRLVGDPPYNRIDNHGQGVEFLGALDLRQRFRMAGRRGGVWSNYLAEIYQVASRRPFVAVAG